MSIGVSERVDVYFDMGDLTAGGVFILDDATYGVLAPSGGTDYPLGGDIAIDITEYVETYDLRRGRSREVDEIAAGSLSVTLFDYEGRFMPDAFWQQSTTSVLQDSTDQENLDEDPAATAQEIEEDGTTVGSPYASNLSPGKRVTVSAGGQSVFDGKIDDWRLTFDGTGRQSVSFTAVDDLALLALKQLDTYSATDTAAGARITTVLGRSEISWPIGDRDIGTGVSTLGTVTVEQGTNPLEYCQLIARSDLGRIFVARDGKLTFRDRNNLTSATSSITFDDTKGGTGVPFISAELEYGDDLLYTDVEIGGTLVATQSATDTDARDAYGIRVLSYTNLLINSSTSQAQTLADDLLAIYKEPLPRVALTLSYDVMEPADQGAVSQLELGDRVTLAWIPRGSIHTIKDYVVEGIGHSAAHDGHFATLSLSPVLTAF